MANVQYIEIALYQILWTKFDNKNVKVWKYEVG